MYKILPPETEGQKYFVIPAQGSGRCWEAKDEIYAKQIIKFLKYNSPELISSIRLL